MGKQDVSWDSRKERITRTNVIFPTLKVAVRTLSDTFVEQMMSGNPPTASLPERACLERGCFTEIIDPGTIKRREGRKGGGGKVLGKYITR